MNKCTCGNSLFPGQFRCEKCGAIVPKEKQVEEPKKPTKRTIKKDKEE